MHPMACGAKDGEVGKAVVGAVAIEMSDLKDLRNTETAMNADRGIRVKGELAVVEKASAHRIRQIDLSSNEKDKARQGVVANALELFRNRAVGFHRAARWFNVAAQKRHAPTYAAEDTEQD